VDGELAVGLALAENCRVLPKASVRVMRSRARGVMSRAKSRQRRSASLAAQVQGLPDGRGGGLVPVGGAVLDAVDGHGGDERLRMWKAAKAENG
jgi:hypothetical protein